MSDFEANAFEAEGDDLLFVPLGGSGEIGMNLNLYGYQGKWLMIDCGVTFGDDTTPGIDLIMPDSAFIEARKDNLVGMVLTHAHEDHIGAVPFLWPRLKCPIYATPFTAEMLRRKLAEHGLEKKAKITEIAMSGSFSVGDFELELVTLTHSIPEPNAVVVRTGAGSVLHTGDWKLDPDPLVGDATDEAALRRIGDAGVLAMVGDSTNALVEGDSGSEGEVRDSLMELVGRFKGRVAVACFASNVARVQTICETAAAHGRSVALIGRSLWRITEAARATGYLQGMPEFLTQQDVARVPRDKILLICTGSQGEPRAALPRIAKGSHQSVSLDAGDAVIFSSRIIPGNERTIGQMHNDLLQLGVEIVTEKDHFVHVSGHPARDELIRMYQWVRPRIAVPVHGEARHMLGHAELARACQVPYAPVISNGDVLLLSPDGPEVLGQVTHGRLAVDGTRLVPLQTDDLRARVHMSQQGSAVLSLLLDAEGFAIADPQLSAPGLLSEGPEDEELLGLAGDDVLDAIEDLPANKRRDDDVVRETARKALRKFFRQELGKKPLVDVHLMRGKE